MRYPTLKVAIFTAYPDVMDHILAQRFGASFYLENYFEKVEKPIPPEQTNPILCCAAPISLKVNLRVRRSALRPSL